MGSEEVKDPLGAGHSFERCDVRTQGRGVVEREQSQRAFRLYFM